MGWTLLSSTSMQDTFSGGVTSSAINTIGADLIVFTYSGSGAVALTDSQGNTWLTAVSTTPNQSASISYTRNPNTSATHTFTATNNNCACAILAYSGSLTSVDPKDQTNSADLITPTTEQPGSITPTQNNELIVYLNSLDAPTANTAGVDSGFTVQFFIEVIVNNAYGSVTSTLVQGTAAAVNPTMTRGQAGAHTDSALIVSFEGAPQSTLPSVEAFVTNYW